MNTMPELGAAVWRKSSYSGASNGDCIEVADGVPGVMPVRDSKDRGRAPLVFPVEAWGAFVGGVRAGALR